MINFAKVNAVGVQGITSRVYESELKEKAKYVDH